MPEKVGSLFVELGLESGKFTQGLKASEGSLKKFGVGLNDIVKGVTGFNLAQIGMAGAIVGGINAARKAIDEYSNYVETVDKMSMSTGMATDEISRLVQVADDFRVDMGSMEGALKMALQNGFNPTTDALARLADEINAIQDPTQKAARLQEIFGKQWQNIIPLLDRGGDAIREASKGIADGLVVTEEAVEANREYQAAVDTLNDSWTEFANTASAAVIPVITDVLNWINQENAALAKQQKLVEQGTKIRIGANGAIIMESGAYMELTESEDRAREAARKNAEVVSGELTPALVDNNTELRYMAGHMDDAAAKAEGMAQASADLAGAVDALQSAQANWKEGAGQDIAGLLDEQKLGAEKFEQALGIVDEVQGTSLLSADKLRDAQEDLTQKFNDGEISAEDFKTGLQDINDQFMPLDESIQDATELMDILLERMNQFSKQWTASVVVDTTAALALANANGGGNSNGYTATSGTSGPGVSGYTDYIRPDAGGANGLDMIVPSGYNERTGTPFMIAASSNERVTITPQGQDSGGAPTQVIMNVYDITDWEQAAYRITQIQRRRRG